MTATEHFESVIPRQDWQRVVPRLLREPGRLAVGRLQRNPHPLSYELLVQDLEIAPDTPNGAQFPPLADWLVLAGPDAAGGVDPQAWIAQLRPRFAQLLSVIVLGLGEQHAGWDGWAVLGGVVRPLAGLRVVGAGMLRISRQGLAEPDDAAEVTERWSRTRGALGDDACRKIRLARVALIGVSRTGSMLAYELAALGVRGLTLVDPDRIEIHNLDAMLGVAEADIGQKKVAVLARRLAEFRGDLAIQGLDCDVTAPAVLERVRAPICWSRVSTTIRQGWRLRCSPGGC